MPGLHARGTAWGRTGHHPLSMFVRTMRELMLMLSMSMSMLWLCLGVG